MRRSGRQVAAALPDDLPTDWLLDELRLDRRQFNAALTGAFARALALEAAERQDVVVETPLFRQTIDEFRRAHELLDGASLAALDAGAGSGPRRVRRADAGRSARAAGRRRCSVRTSAAGSWINFVSPASMARSRGVRATRLRALAERGPRQPVASATPPSMRPACCAGSSSIAGRAGAGQPGPARRQSWLPRSGQLHPGAAARVLLLDLSARRRPGHLAQGTKVGMERAADRLVVEDPAAFGHDQHQRRERLVDADRWRRRTAARRASTGTCSQFER